MDLVASLLSILAVLLVGVISPGPSFLLVAQTAVSDSRKAAVFSALGMALGASLLSVLALAGLHAVLRQFPGAYLAMKTIGSVYLLYLAVQLWRQAATPLAVASLASSGTSPLRHGVVALGVMITNPKAAVQYGVIFASFLPQHPSLALSLILPACVFALEGGWYTIVALTLSSNRARTSYLGAKRHIDRIAALLLGAMSVRLLVF